VIDRKSTVEELELQVGHQVRAARVAAGLSQKELASLANISLATLSNLERGNGSSLRTLVAAARALGRTDWLESFAPVVTVSPMRMLKAKKSLSRQRAERVRHRPLRPSRPREGR
jgi:transcriptional regulator with XRE-family HTH domain